MTFKCHWLLTLLLSSTTLVIRSTTTQNDLRAPIFGAQNSSYVYQDICECKRNEFYDLDYFECRACNADDSDLQPTENKLACQCRGTNGASVSSIIAFYDDNKRQPSCATYNNTKCNDHHQQQTIATITTPSSTKITTINCPPTLVGKICALKYVNKTDNNELMTQLMKSEQLKFSKKSSSSALLLHITHLKFFENVKNAANDGTGNDDDEICHCDLIYNFRYQDYCIANELLKPYLHYNAFWQSSTIGGSGSSTATHFGDLKFVAFFCLRLQNITACQQLANLCVMSHFSLDKNSPCSAFLLTQASDVVMRYASGMDEQLRTLRPFLFFRKGKQMAQQLSEPISQSNAYSLSSNKPNSHLQIFSFNFALDGSLLRRGAFQMAHLDLCGAFENTLKFQFGAVYKPVECFLSLENLIDVASAKMQHNFISLYLNFTKTSKPHKIFMQSIPVLVEKLTVENQRSQTADWLLVRRFQMITAQPRLHYGPAVKPIYDDAYKLQKYRSIHFVENIEFHYKVYAGNRINVPLMRLRYRNIEIQANSSLNQMFKFKMSIKFSQAKDDQQSSASTSVRRDVLNETLLPLLLLLAITISMLRAHNHRKRRRTTILTGTTSTPQTVPVDLCDFRAFLEFMLQLCSNAANVLLICFLAHVIYDATKFFTQKELSITLPLIEKENNATTINILIYAALCLKFVFYTFHLWQTSHFDIFFIDWERPKSYDNNHFNLKSNLDTSSVCSSVRTFITESSVSAWRIFFVANEWIRLSVKRKTFIFIQYLVLLALFNLFNIELELARDDLMLKLYFIVLLYLSVYIVQQLIRIIIIDRFKGDPLKKFIDLCSWANISVFVLLEPSYGFYIHGRSPHGFAEADMSSMLMQLRRESQSMCGRRGLLSDSDQQTYVILPPANLRTFFQRLLVPFQRSCSISQAHYQKESTSISAVSGNDGHSERTFIAYSSVNRFFCAFIDHAIKDMDYIIKEMTILERFLNCEFENYLTENKGTFYIDKTNAFSRLFLYGNEFHTFTMEFLLFISTFMLSENLICASVTVCFFNVLVHWIYSKWMRQNISKKTLIDKRFLI